VTRIAIFSVSAGAGHVRAAQAIEAAAAAYPGVEATHVDLMSIVNTPFRKVYADGYLRVVRHSPATWRRMYALTDAPASSSRTNRVREAIERANLRRFEGLVRAIAPDHVVCTHFLPAALLSRMTARGQTTVPTWVAVTDFDFHASWLHDRMAGYLAADEAVVRRMVERGVDPVRAFATGIPVAPVFGEPHDRAECAASFGLDPARPTVALMAGNSGITPVDEVAGDVLALDDTIQVVAIAGRNTQLLGRLRAVADAPANRGRMAAVGFTTTIERVMAAADIVVAKPGGLTVSECLAMGLPMIVVSPIPGQEERNARFLSERGAAVEADDGAEVVRHVRRLLLDGRGAGADAVADAPGEALASMRAAARSLGRPDAARRVLDIVLGQAASRA
jgi:processive 1,2-diacylglycerol beta-glucosyltransferase